MYELYTKSKGVIKYALLSRNPKCAMDDDIGVTILLFFIGLIIVFCMLFSCIRVVQYLQTRRRSRSVSIEDALVVSRA